MILDADVVVTGLVLVCALPSLAYTLFYLYRPWTSTPQGRALMVKSWGNVILLGMAVAYALLGEYEARPYVRAAGFFLFAGGIWYLLWALLRSEGADKYPPYTWGRWLRDRWRRLWTRR